MKKIWFGIFLVVYFFNGLSSLWANYDWLKILNALGWFIAGIYYLLLEIEDK